MTADPGEGIRSPFLQGDLEEGLGDLYPALAILDRGLVMEDGAGPVEVDLVAVDGDGGLVLAILVQGAAPGEEADPGEDLEVGGDDDGVLGGEGGADAIGGIALAALRILAWARANRGLLARHLEDPRLAERPPRVVLVAAGFEPHSLASLAPLLPGAVTLLEVRTLRSARGVSTFLVPLPRGSAAEEGDGAGEAGGEAVDPALFLEGLDGKLRPLAEELIRRLERVDDRLSCTPREGGLGWTMGGQDLCSLSLGEGRLQGGLPDRAEPMVLTREGDVELFLDATLARYVDLIGQPEDYESLPEVELVPVEPQPLLTAEELEAFRQ